MTPAMMAMGIIGAFTAIFSATIAVAQNDIKKVLAYSTISQLGYMVMGLGVGAYTAGFFHLTTHAMFKAGLFLGSGSVIHAMHHALHHAGDHHTDAQDIRNMGGLKAKMPITFWTFVMYTLAISGVPLTSGFLSKDEILAGTLAYANLTGQWYIPIVAYVVAAMTAFYMFRLVILTFLGEHKDHHRLEAIHESPKTMTISLPLASDLYVRKATVDFRAAAAYDDELEVCGRVARIGTSSLQFSVEMYRRHAADAPLEAVDLVYVHVDAASKAPRAVDDALRAKIRAFEAKAPDETHAAAR